MVLSGFAAYIFDGKDLNDCGYTGIERCKVNDFTIGYYGTEGMVDT